MLSVLTIGLLIAPGARHRIVEEGAPTNEFNCYVSRVALSSLLVFDVALAGQIFVVASAMAGTLFALASAVAASLLGAGLWFGPYLFNKAEVAMPDEDQSAKPEQKAEFALTEARVVLPGAQALLGFQFIAVLTEAFAALPQAYKITHVTALACIIVSTMLLLTPAAYHRIVYGGAFRPEFYQIATRYILGATVFLAAGISLDMVVIGQAAIGKRLVGVGIGAATFLLLMGLWLVWPMVLRRKRSG